MSKQFPHNEMRRNAAIRCQRKVMDMLEWDLLRYTTFKYEEGLVFLAIYLNGDEWAMSVLERSATFWGWWKNLWTIREEEFVQQYETMMQCSIDIRESSYIAMHKAEMLADERRAASGTIDDSYANMIGIVFKEAKKQKV